MCDSAAFHHIALTAKSWMGGLSAVGDVPSSCGCWLLHRFLLSGCVVSSPDVRDVKSLLVDSQVHQLFLDRRVGEWKTYTPPSNHSPTRKSSSDVARLAVDEQAAAGELAVYSGVVTTLSRSAATLLAAT